MVQKIVKKEKKRTKPILILLLVVLAASVYWVWQKNIFAKDNLKLEILGPGQVDFAQDFDYTVQYKNNGTVRFEDAKLIFEYPEHSIIKDQKSARQEIQLGDINPGEEKTVTFNARLIGQESEIKIAKASLSYKPKNLKTPYESQTTFATQIKSVPLNFEFDMPSKIESGKTFKFRLNYFSNVDYPLSGLRIEARYPVGFEFVSSNPSSMEKVEWEIPPLNRAEGGRIEISGKMLGEIGEQKIFDAKLGMWQDGEFILFKEIVRGLEITKPALRITQQINGNADYVANAGDQLHYEIFFKNLGDGILNNLTLVNTLDGNIFDLQSLKAPEGSFTLGDNSIVWDWKRVVELQFLSPQEENKVEFWVNLKSDFEIPSLDGNLIIKNNVYLDQIKEEFTIKVNSKLEVAQMGFFQDEIFGNSGPIPPRAGQTTTYTINWQAKNYYNEVKNVKVKTILPQYVQLTGKIFPEDARLTFDSQSREIVWETGDLQVGQGVLNPAPNVSFQVAFLPSTSQIGQIPNIISQTKITGDDSWTNDITEQISLGVNTSFNATDTVSLQQGTVTY
ncbi:MAG: hypothetical protein ABH813_00075 [Patescibacteria group bacterium]